MNARELFGHWDQARRDLYRALDVLDDTHLSFAPAEGLWSLGQVAVHIASAEDGWLRYVIKRETDSWPALQLADYPTVESIRALLVEVHARTVAFLDTLDEADLDREIEAPWGKRFSLRWIVWHVLEHEIHHRGELYLMLGLLGLEAPDW